MTFPAGELVTVIDREVTRDQYGNETVTETRRDVSGCAVYPQESSENWQVGRSSTVVGLIIYMPPQDPPLVSIDGVEWRGGEYELAGDPGDWTNPYTGWNPGLQIAVRRVTG